MSAARSCAACGGEPPLWFVPEVGSCCAVCAALFEDQDLTVDDLDRVQGEHPSALLLRVVRCLSEARPDPNVDAKEVRAHIAWLIAGLDGEHLAWAERLIETVAGMP